MGNNNKHLSFLYRFIVNLTLTLHKTYNLKLYVIFVAKL